MLLDMTFRIQDPAWECACEALNQTDDASCTPLSDMLHIAINECSILWGPGARYYHPATCVGPIYWVTSMRSMSTCLVSCSLPLSRQELLSSFGVPCSMHWAVPDQIE